MGIKFYLNKFAKIDNIENYSFSTVMALNKEYTDFLERTGGIDPDFPGMDFSGNGKKVNEGITEDSVKDDKPQDNSL